jgi:ferrous iron transport protein B
MRLALVGVPNSGKTALFNRLTGSRQKVANYAGVTVERKEGSFVGPSRRRQYRVLDLPGSYSLTPTTLDEAITRDFLLGRLAGESAPEFVVCVVDATNLRLNLRLVLELRDLGVPMIVALNMSDLARNRGFRLDRERLEREIGVPVVETVAVANGGHRELLDTLEDVAHPGAPQRRDWRDPSFEHIQQTQREVRRILRAIDYAEPARSEALRRLDAVVMHPVAGPAILAVLLFFVFQAVFSWARLPMDMINAGVSWVGRSWSCSSSSSRSRRPATCRAPPTCSIA